MANKIIEQTVPRYKINGISTLTFCSTRAISKPSAVCFGNSSNPPIQPIYKKEKRGVVRLSIKRHSAWPGNK